MTLRWLRGDCRETLRTLDAGSVQCAITSPPYWSLRDYGTPPLVWGGDSEHEHAFGAALRAPWANELPSANSFTTRNNAYHETMGKTAGQFCPCGAWMGSLGLEPDPFCGGRGLVRLRRDLTPAQREYVVRRLLGAASHDDEHGGTNGTA